MIKIIAAISNDLGLGKDNKLLWSLPNDLKRFKELTLNSSIIMGRKTFDSIGKPLPNRENIIITRDVNYKKKGCLVFNDLESALEYTKNDCFIIGGGEIYKQSIHLADMVFLTMVDCDIESDTFFPFMDIRKWKISSIKENKPDGKHNFKYTYVDYERR